MMALLHRCTVMAVLPTILLLQIATMANTNNLLLPCEVCLPTTSQEDAMAAAMQAMQAREQARKEDKKRKREEEEKWSRVVKNKLKDESNRIDREERSSHESNRELYALFNELQGISHDFNIHFETPEIVVVGMQSDGKSSFIEALLGFQFNVVETNIGTRRPLILQMINNPEKEVPSCRFRKESSYTSTLQPGGGSDPSGGEIGNDHDAFELVDTPIDCLVDEIVRRTNEKAGRGEGVCAQPIILRVEYAHCSNLTIYDTPGFRLGGDTRLKEEIEKMVQDLMRPSNRIIVCLEQSTVEWANSSSRPIVRRFDPQFSRTVLVNTKFDNRVKELRKKESADKYLMGENLPPGKKPFFISLPVRRNLDSDRFRDAIKEVYLQDYQTLLEVRFDEDKFGEQVGFFRTKAYLEELLSERYYASVAPTLRTLDTVCKRTKLELATVKKELESTDLELLKTKVNSYVQSFILLVERLLEGSIIGNPDVFGQTLLEEKSTSGIGEWPGLAIDYQVPNSGFKVYGGAQYERLLTEFEYVAHSKEFPPTSINEVAAAIGTSKFHNVPVYETAASDIVQIKARQEFLPLIDVVLARCTYIMKRLCDISISVMKSTDSGVLNVYEPFVEELRSNYYKFVDQTETVCRDKLMDDFETFTKVLDWDLVSGLSELKDYDYLNNDEEATKARVSRMMERKAEENPMLLPITRSRALTEETFTHVCTMSAKLFSGIRFFFVKYIRNKLNAFFLDPMFQKLGGAITNYFRRLNNDHYEKMFQLGAEELRERVTLLEHQLAHCTAARDKFKALYRRLLDKKHE
ncbi:putative Interferon-induced GTP-binding protein Mx2 [Balamuthia mandrillaris]